MDAHTKFGKYARLIGTDAGDKSGFGRAETETARPAMLCAMEGPELFGKGLHYLCKGRVIHYFVFKGPHFWVAHRRSILLLLEVERCS